MEWFDALTLSRLQFAFTVSFHIIFPSFSIGLASYLAVLNFLHLKTDNPVYLTLFNYWKKIFAVAFGMGVVSGVVMSYQFGTNWSVFADKAGPVIGPLMGYEVMSAFFLEAGFLGIMLFGRTRVGPRLHFLATLMVAVGTAFSAFWILAVNSWMQTPAGYEMNEVGQFVVKNWLEVIFNPSFPYRFVHMVLAAYLTTALVVGAVGAWHLLRANAKSRHGEPSSGGLSDAAVRKMFSMAMWMIAIVAPLQILAGDQHGLNTVKHQPMKIAAIEGHYESAAGAPLLLFGIPNTAEKKMEYVVEIPRLGSLIVTHSWDGTIKGLKEFPEADWPPVAIVFFAFRVMVGMGTLMLCLGLWSLWARHRRQLYDNTWLHKAAVTMGPAGFVAVLAGWVVTEVGRQPFTVYGLLRTAESHSPVAASAVATTLVSFIVVYFVLFGAGVYYILKLMSKPPADKESSLVPASPLRAGGMMGSAAGINVTPQTNASSKGGRS